MKKIIVSLTFCLALCWPAFSQTAQADELQNLNKQIPVLLQQGALEQVISTAERIVEIEKLGGEKNLVNYSTALLNLALWKKQRIIVLFQSRNNPSALGGKAGLPGILNAKQSTLQTEVEQTKELFQDLLKIFQTRVNEPLQLATVQSELAVLYCAYPDREDKTDDAENLFLQSLAVREKSLGNDSDAVLSLVFKIAAFYFYTADFEKSLPYIERYVSTVEAKYGKTDKRLIPALRLYADFFVTTNQESKADESVKQLAAITGKTESRPELNNILLRRAVSKLNAAIGGPRLSSNIVPVNVSNSPYPYNPVISGDRIIFWNDPRGNTNRGIRGSDLPSASYNRAEPQFSPVRARRKTYRQVKVPFWVDEKGQVIEATPQTTDKEISDKIRERVMKWKFKPFVYQTVAQRMRGFVWITYYK